MSIISFIRAGVILVPSIRLANDAKVDQPWYKEDRQCKNKEARNATESIKIAAGLRAGRMMPYVAAMTLSGTNSNWTGISTWSWENLFHLVPWVRELWIYYLSLLNPDLRLLHLGGNITHRVVRSTHPPGCGPPPLFPTFTTFASPYTSHFWPWLVLSGLWCQSHLVVPQPLETYSPVPATHRAWVTTIKATNLTDRSVRLIILKHHGWIAIHLRPSYQLPR